MKCPERGNTTLGLSLPIDHFYARGFRPTHIPHHVWISMHIKRLITACCRLSILAEGSVIAAKTRALLRFVFTGDELLWNWMAAASFGEWLSCAHNLLQGSQPNAYRCDFQHHWARVGAVQSRQALRSDWHVSQGRLDSGQASHATHSGRPPIVDVVQMAFHECPHAGPKEGRCWQKRGHNSEGKWRRWPITRERSQTNFHQTAGDRSNRAETSTLHH